ncbi:uncharacterized protein BDR25DRAFT_355277 [Lindgomyces ingoldianus]|uniref:Uncharacterized protein n=1 Tax=Lindgomyces ingoldianus TaxID=673940 RepID=A0ACB6QXI5_9PLEO|nr:uncharacterized protein BDR25DRAFT_355277 [Lindgomyces ingoldianus]KAF2470797.1 hypothetical protein BDR25DRAFT_355277 [Lindgomyces ingoldianus]
MACLPSGRIGNNPAAAVVVRFDGGNWRRSSEYKKTSWSVTRTPSIAGWSSTISGRPAQMDRTEFINALPTVLLDAIAKLWANHYRGLNNILAHLSTSDWSARFSRETTGSDVLFQAAYEGLQGSSTPSTHPVRAELSRLAALIIGYAVQNEDVFSTAYCLVLLSRQLHTQLSRQESVGLSSLSRDANLDKRFRVDLKSNIYLCLISASRPIQDRQKELENRNQSKVPVPAELLLNLVQIDLEFVLLIPFIGTFYCLGIH